MGNILLVVLIVLVASIVVNLINDKSVVGQKLMRCTGPHTWYSIVDEKGNDMGMLCIACGFKAGEV